MAPDHQTSERVYSALKVDILDGLLGKGRFNIPALESRYATSATPVREALLRLVGEGLVDMRPAGGFGAWQLGPAECRQLYEFNLKMVLLSATWTKSELHSELAHDGKGLNPLIDTLGVAEKTRNVVTVSTMESLNDRLHQLRRAEEGVLGGLDREFQTLRDALADAPTGAARRAIGAYHTRRIRHLDEILRALRL